MSLIDATQGVWVPLPILHGAGSGAPAILLAQLLYHFRHDPEGQFVAADASWLERTGLSTDQVTRARTALVDANLIRCGKQRIDGSMTTVYELDFEGLDAMVERWGSATSKSRIRDSRSRESATSSFLPTDVEQPPIGGGPQASRAARRATALPSDFAVTEPMRAWAVENCPAVDIERETEQFKDHHTAKGSRFKDWSAAWRTWMRRSVEYNPQRVVTNGNGATAPRAWANIERVRQGKR